MEFFLKSMETRSLITFIHIMEISLNKMKTLSYNLFLERHSTTIRKEGSNLVSLRRQLLFILHQETYISRKRVTFCQIQIYTFPLLMSVVEILMNCKQSCYLKQRKMPKIPLGC